MLNGDDYNDEDVLVMLEIPKNNSHGIILTLLKLSLLFVILSPAGLLRYLREGFIGYNRTVLLGFRDQVWLELF